MSTSSLSLHYDTFIVKVLDYDTFIKFMMISSALTLSQNLWLVSTHIYYFLVCMSHQSSQKGSCFSSAEI